MVVGCVRCVGLVTGAVRIRRVVVGVAMVMAMVLVGMMGMRTALLRAGMGNAGKRVVPMPVRVRHQLERVRDRHHQRGDCKPALSLLQTGHGGTITSRPRPVNGVRVTGGQKACEGLEAASAGSGVHGYCARYLQVPCQRLALAGAPLKVARGTG